MHQIDPMKRERATAILLIFRHPLLKLEKKIKVSSNPLNQKNMPTMAGILEKLILWQWKLPPEVSWLDSFLCMSLILMIYGIDIGEIYAKIFGTYMASEGVKWSHKCIQFYPNFIKRGRGMKWQIFPKFELVYIIIVQEHYGIFPLFVTFLAAKQA